MKNLNPKSGRILISEPFMLDPNFKRSVVFLAEHNEEGSIGFVLNHKLDTSLSEIMPEYRGPFVPLRQGGPVELDTLHILHRVSQIDEATPIGNELFWGGQFDQILEGLELGTFRPEDFIFCMGYSGWAPEQLAAEINSEAWLVSNPSSSLLFDPSISEKDFWKKSVENLGGTLAFMANAPENPMLN